MGMNPEDFEKLVEKFKGAAGGVSEGPTILERVRAEYKVKKEEHEARKRADYEAYEAYRDSQRASALSYADYVKYQEFQKKNQFLFIGGSRHGQLHSVPAHDGPYHYLRVPITNTNNIEAIDFGSMNCPSPYLPEISTENYLLAYYRLSYDYVISIYILSTLDPKAVSSTVESALNNALRRY